MSSYTRTSNDPVTLESDTEESGAKNTKMNYPGSNRKYSSKAQPQRKLGN